MSKSTNQTLALLAVVAGSMAMLRYKNAFARIDMKEKVDFVYRETGRIIENWPCTGNEQKNCKWISDRVQGQWDPFIRADKDRYGTPVLAAICERIIADLTTKIRNRQKLQMLSVLEKPLKDIHDFADPEGRNFMAYQKCDYALDELYRILEWNW